MSQGTPSRTSQSSRARKCTHTDTCVRIHARIHIEIGIERATLMRRTPSTLQTASLRWLAFAYENQEVSRLASYSRRRRTGLGRVPGTRTSRSNPRWSSGGRTTTAAAATTEAAAAQGALASAVLNIQWRHVLDSACRLAAANHMFPRQASFCI